VGIFVAEKPAGKGKNLSGTPVLLGGPAADFRTQLADLAAIISPWSESTLIQAAALAALINGAYPLSHQS